MRGIDRKSKVPSCQEVKHFRIWKCGAPNREDKPVPGPVLHLFVTCQVSTGPGSSTHSQDVGAKESYFYIYFVLRAT